jgi:predicted neutral ceramidase superfamily lipid hydrolase
MEKSKFIRTFLINYFVIFGIIMLLTLLLIPDYDFNRSSILLIAAAALLGDIPGLILYDTDKLSLMAFRFRLILHFLLLEMVILLFGCFMGIVTTAAQLLIFSVEIAVIYLLVRLICWGGDKSTVNKINQKLKELDGK